MKLQAYVFTMIILKVIFNFSFSLAIFAVSLRVLSDSMNAFLGTRLQTLFLLLTSNPPMSILTGALATAVVQSSSTVNVLMVTLVNAKMINLYEAFGVVLGANIGTTITAQIVSLDLSQYALPIILLGLFILPWNRKTRMCGSALIGLGGLFYSLSLLKISLLPIVNHPFAIKMLINISENFYLGILVGLFFTAIVQSSSVITTLVITLTQLGALNLLSAVAIALGSNIGTVVTTLIASIGLSKEAKATAFADFIFNVLGVVIILPFIRVFVRLVSITSHDLGRQVANAHTIFNLVTAVFALPFIRPLTDIAKRWAGIGR